MAWLHLILEHVVNTRCRGKECQAILGNLATIHTRSCLVSHVLGVPWSQVHSVEFAWIPFQNYDTPNVSFNTMNLDGCFFFLFEVHFVYLLRRTIFPLHFFFISFLLSDDKFNILISVTIRWPSISEHSERSEIASLRLYTISSPQLTSNQTYRRLFRSIEWGIPSPQVE